MSRDSSVAVPTVNKSLLFANFNRSRARAAGLCRKRCNRALGLVLSGKVRLLEDGTAVADGSRGETYYINADGCNCKDTVYNGVAWCKHRIARGYKIRVAEQEEATLTPPEPVTVPALEDDIALLYGVA